MAGTVVKEESTVGAEVPNKPLTRNARRAERSRLSEEQRLMKLKQGKGVQKSMSGAIEGSGRRKAMIDARKHLQKVNKSGKGEVSAWEQSDEELVDAEFEGGNEFDEESDDLLDDVEDVKSDFPPCVGKPGRYSMDADLRDRMLGLRAKLKKALMAKQRVVDKADGDVKVDDSSNSKEVFQNVDEKAEIFVSKSESVDAVAVKSKFIDVVDDSMVANSESVDPMKSMSDA